MSNQPVKTAIITAGTKGMSNGIADRLAQLGMNLVIAYDSDDKTAQASSADRARASASTTSAPA